NRSPSSASPRRVRPVVAIDGPAGAGKSTVTRRVAQTLGYTVVDTGALYRTVALVCSERKIAWDDTQQVARVAQELADGDVLTLVQDADRVRVLLGDRDVSSEIRSQEMGKGASIVSAQPAVRSALLDLQRRLGRQGGV